MDRRTLLALVLMLAVFAITPFLFPGARRAQKAAADSALAIHVRDSVAAASAANAATNAAANAPAVAPPSTVTPAISAAPVKAESATVAVARPVVPESVTVGGPQAQLVLANPGATVSSAVVHGYRGLRPGRADTSLRMTQSRGPMLRYRLARPTDTLALDTIPFTVTTAGDSTTFTSPVITLSYKTSDGLHTLVRGSVPSAQPGTALLVDLPSDFVSMEADTLDDQRHLAYGYRVSPRDPVSVPFSKLEPGVQRTDTGSFQWVDARNKYWIVALMQPVEEYNAGDLTKHRGVFRALAMVGGQRVGKVAPTAAATALYPIANGRIAFDLYAGPQKFANLNPLGNDLENANPYAGFLHAVVQPFATIVMRVLLWLKATTRLNYGWVLILFGVLLRLVMWPLYQRSMKTSMQMQRIQPELQAAQERYKSDPDKLRDATMKVYADHGMNPFSPLLGCLPMFLPLPILYALYHVFQNTVEFRGVSFLWIPDLSLRDPFYITPLAMGASMLLLSWIGMRNMPPNPQAKMMSYMMPLVFIIMFVNFPAGLNLYYAAQNLATLPQQWLIARERAKAGLTTATPARGARSAPAKRQT